MSARYEINRNENGTSYHFITSSGNTYIAYFTEFTMLNRNRKDVPILSFGFSCKLTDDDEPQRYDRKIKSTIIYIIEEFFNALPTESILYFCMNQDGKAKNRHLIFDKWFKEFSHGLEKHNTPEASAKHDFYGSILLKSANPNKQKFIDAFYFTIDYWDLGC
ncbi:DUF6169 family protein [Pedobacter alpinus]|uniref:DUF6169 family protein n=1 Tax=Pedobacter alpinus TaxID=1590643 RepID=A0ABW5TSI7_9SPHI